MIRTEIDNFPELRTRRVMQNTFGIITSSLRICRSLMTATADKVDLRRYVLLYLIS